jgi:hypothetical protein
MFHFLDQAKNGVVILGGQKVKIDDVDRYDVWQFEVVMSHFQIFGEFPAPAPFSLNIYPQIAYPNKEYCRIIKTMGEPT